MAVLLKDLIDGMDMQMDEYRQFLNKETGVVVSVSNEELSIAEGSEEDDAFSQYPDWQREAIQQALDIDLNWENYIELPNKWEVDEYHIMEQFCDSLDNEKIATTLFSAISGKGAFRRFKDTVQRYGIENRWYSYREEALKKIALSWCEQNNISYRL